MRVPLFIEMSGKSVLIIGGGSVGTSRTKKFLSAGADVTVLSLDFSHELERLGEKRRVKLVEGDASDRDLLEGLISESDLVVVSLNTLEFNEAVNELAREHGAMINLANDAAATEVVVPFEAEVNGLRIAMTSEGKSGMVVREALRRIVEFLSEDREIADLLNLMHHLKRFMKSTGVPVKTRMELYYEVFDDEEFRRLVMAGEVEEARRRAEEIVRVRAL